MDGRGRCLDNIFIERLWRSLKYEEVYLKDYRLVPEARAGIGRYFQFYNHERLHQIGLPDAGGDLPGVRIAAWRTGWISVR